MGLAPAAHVLFNKFMTFNPKNPEWVNRDRFVLSYVSALVLLICTQDMALERRDLLGQCSPQALSSSNNALISNLN